MAKSGLLPGRCGVLGRTGAVGRPVVDALLALDRDLVLPDLVVPDRGSGASRVCAAPGDFRVAMIGHGLDRPVVVGLHDFSSGKADANHLMRRPATGWVTGGSAEENVPGGGQAGDARRYYLALGRTDLGGIDHPGTSFHIARRRGYLRCQATRGRPGPSS